MRTAISDALLPVSLGKTIRIPLAPESVHAGFPSPRQDYWSGDLDIAAHLIRDEASTFIWRVPGPRSRLPRSNNGLLRRAKLPRDQ